jgi:hypothetical protein
VHAVAGEHAAHAAGALAYVPTGHVEELNAQEGAPATLNTPTAHKRQAVLEVLPVAGLYVPAAQSVQDAAPASDHAPARQTICVALVEPAGQ